MGWRSKEYLPRPSRPRVAADLGGTYPGPISGDVHADVTGARTRRTVHVIQDGHALTTVVVGASVGVPGHLSWGAYAKSSGFG
jgi:hypothetical protein